MQKRIILIWKKKYNPDEVTKYLLYLDANGLYGWAMCNALPVGDFAWMNKEELQNWKKNSLYSRSGFGISNRIT